MILNVIPQRLSGAADELRRSERVLTYAGYSLEETIDSLKHSEDESMLVIAAKLSKTLDRLRIRIRVTRAMFTALDRIAAAYMRAEEKAVSYEDEINAAEYMRYRSRDISRIRKKAAKAFERL